MGRHSRRVRWLIAGLLLLLPAQPRTAQVDEYQVKALFLVGFLKFANWPPEPDTGPLVVGVLGDDPFDGALDAAARQGAVGTRQVTVVRLRTPTEIGRVHLLFIAASERQALPSILRMIDGRPILTVGDTPGFAQAGVALNFYTAGTRLAFETNTGAVARARIRLSAHLLKLARVVG